METKFKAMRAKVKEVLATLDFTSIITRDERKPVLMSFPHNPTCVKLG